MFKFFYAILSGIETSGTLKEYKNTRIQYIVTILFHSLVKISMFSLILLYLLLGEDLFKGDIILSPQQKQALKAFRNKRNTAPKGTSYGYSSDKMNIQMWRFGKVPYRISPRLGMKVILLKHLRAAQIEPTF